jgi:dynein heavy chain
MYQYSLQYVEKIFNMAMDTAEKHEQLAKRLTSLINNITQDIYRNVTRGLFGKDKILFSFMIATSINREANIIS